MDKSEFIKRRIKELYGSINKFSKEVGIPQSTLSTALNKKDGFDNMSVSYGLKICKALGLDVEKLYMNEYDEEVYQEDKLIDIYRSVSPAGKELILGHAESVKKYEDNKVITFIPMYSEPEPPTTQIPYFDQAAGMGGGQYISNAVMEKIEVPTGDVPPGTDFAIRVVGDSMEPTFHTGDKLYIHKTNALEPGEIGVFNVEGEQFVKEYQPGELVSHNKDYPPMKITTRDCYIQGKVLGIIKKGPVGPD